MFAKKMFLALSIFSSFLHEFCLRVLSFASEKNFNISRESILTESCRLKEEEAKEKATNG
jgi:hypothetical protein